MGRRQTISKVCRSALPVLFLLGMVSCCMVLLWLPAVLKPTTNTAINQVLGLGDNDSGGSGAEEIKEEVCCKGLEHLELWGDAVKWGAEHKMNSSRECCMACKGMCGSDDGPCLCNSWVFCGNRDACGPRFGECWLKKQKSSLYPDHRDSGNHVMWTSGLIFRKREGIIGLETEYGIIRIQLFPDYAPQSVASILELLQLHHSVGSRFYRAEKRDWYWDSEGNHVENAPFGPPFAMIQGTLEVHGTVFKEIPKEVCPSIKRGSVAWVGSGPEFFISLANHFEWKRTYTVFGSVLSQDMGILERISMLPSKHEVWSDINVSVLETPVSFQLRSLETNHGNRKL